MATVTVPGSPSVNGGAPLTYTFNTGAGLTVAQQIAAALASASTLSVTSSSSGGAIAGPTTVSGTLQDLVLFGSNSSTVSAGFNVITNVAPGPATINAASGTAISCLYCLPDM